MFNFLNGALVCAFFIVLESKAQNIQFINNSPEGVQKSVPDSSSLTNCDRENCFCDNDLTPAGVMISHVHEKGEWMIAYRYMQMDMQGTGIGTNHINASEVLNQYTATGNKMNMKMQMLMMMYGLSDRLTFMGMLHFNNNYMEMTMKTGDHQHNHAMKTNGIGDTRLSALYALIKKEHVELIVSTGINLPTGSIDVKGNALDMMYPNSRLPYNMQLGSGSWDLLPGITFIQNKEKSSMSAQLNSNLRMFNNKLGYRYGNEYTASIWYAHSWLSFISTSARIECSFLEKIKHADTSLTAFSEPAANPNNYGGTFLNAYLGSTVNIKQRFLKRFRFGLEYGIPFYQNFNGIQMPLKQNLIINSSFKF